MHDHSGIDGTLRPGVLGKGKFAKKGAILLPVVTVHWRETHQEGSGYVVILALKFRMEARVSSVTSQGFLLIVKKRIPTPTLQQL